MVTAKFKLLVLLRRCTIDFYGVFIDIEFFIAFKLNLNVATDAF